MEEELADQRHAAWIEECGLDPSDLERYVLNIAQ
jgi:hypothetical protein